MIISILVILFYRGVLPFAQRKKLWEKYKAKARKLRSSTASSNDISYGAHVCMKNSPIYHPGAVGNPSNINCYTSVTNINNAAL